MVEHFILAEIIAAKLILIVEDNHNVSRYNCQVIDKVIRFSTIPMQPNSLNDPSRRKSHGCESA